MKVFFFLVAALGLLNSCGRKNDAGLHVNPAIESELRQVAAIDNHAHPLKVTSSGEEDHDYDALPVSLLTDAAMPAPLRPGNPYFLEAWRALFKFSFADDSPAHLELLTRSRHRLAQEKGDNYPSFILDRTNTSIMLANRVSMGRGLPSDRFKWVPFADSFLFPLDNTQARSANPDRDVFIQAESSLLQHQLSASQLASLPPTLDDYVTFVSHMLESWKASGAVALKFEAAYLRELDFSNPSREEAIRIYTVYAPSNRGRPVPPPEEYKTLQDYLFRRIALEAGRLNLPVHIHSSLGAGSYFRAANANPLPLESLFNDPALRHTRFVLLHGAWPYTREAAALLLKPNVYLDYSGFIYLAYPAESARALRVYLEAAPEKVLYGSDASPVSDTVGWEDSAWIAAHYGRLSLAAALTGMQDDGEISLDRAREIGRMVLRDNAHQLYGF